MRRLGFLVTVLLTPGIALASGGPVHCARSPEVEYARWRAQLCDPARNVEIEAQRHYTNAAYLQIYGMPRLPLVPSRMIDPNLPVPAPAPR